MGAVGRIGDSTTGEIQRERPRLSGMKNLAGKGVGEFLVFHLGEAAGGTSLSLERTTCRTLSCFDRARGATHILRHQPDLSGCLRGQLITPAFPTGRVYRPRLKSQYKLNNFPIFRLMGRQALLIVDRWMHYRPRPKFSAGVAAPRRPTGSCSLNTHLRGACPSNGRDWDGSEMPRMRGA